MLGDDNEGIALVKAEQFEEKLSMAIRFLVKILRNEVLCMFVQNVIRKCEKDTFSAVKTAHSALPMKCLEYSQMRKQPKDLLKSHRLKRATERKWKHAYVRIAG